MFKQKKKNRKTEKIHRKTNTNYWQTEKISLQKKSKILENRKSSIGKQKKTHLKARTNFGFKFFAEIVKPKKV